MYTSNEYHRMCQWGDADFKNRPHRLAQRPGRPRFYISRSTCPFRVRSPFLKYMLAVDGDLFVFHRKRTGEAIRQSHLDMIYDANEIAIQL